MYVESKIDYIEFSYTSLHIHLYIFVVVVN